MNSEDDSRSSWRRSVRTEMKSLESSQGGTVSGAVVLISIFTGICGAISVFFAQQVKSAEFYVFADYIITIMEQPQYMDQLTFGAFLAGLALFTVSFGLMIASLFQKRKLTTLFILLIIAAAILQIAGGGLILSYINNLDASTNQGAPEENNAARQLQDFSIAMYEQCCRLPGHIGPDAAITRLQIDIDDSRWDNIVTCAEFFSGTYYNTLSDVEKVVEACVGNLAHVQWFELAVTDYVCSTLNSTIVDISGLTLGTLSIEQLTRPTTEIPVVGDASEPIYGCGGGKIKAFQYMNYAWLVNVCRPPAIALISTGAIALLLGLFACASLGLTSSQDMDFNTLLFNSYVDDSFQTQHSARNSVRQSVEMNRRSASRPARPLSSDMIEVATPVNIDDKI